MQALVVYESVYGNTRSIAEAVAEGLGGPPAVPVSKAETSGVELLVVGGPTHMHGLATHRSRQAAAEAAKEDGTHLEPGATEDPGLRMWLRELPTGAGMRAATFDTRLDKASWLTGLASRGIARRLRQHDYEVIASESFLVVDSEGPLEPGELERARAWGQQLASAFADSGVAS